MTKYAGTIPPSQVRDEPERATSSGQKSATINTDISAALDPLEGSCATLARGYWSYKWCHRGSVIQVDCCVSGVVMAAPLNHCCCGFVEHHHYFSCAHYDTAFQCTHHPLME